MLKIRSFAGKKGEVMRMQMIWQGEKPLKCHEYADITTQSSLRQAWLTIGNTSSMVDLGMSSSLFESRSGCDRITSA